MRTPGRIRIANWRKRNPEKALYTWIRQNAKRRGIEFKLTFEQFLIFCLRTDYMQYRGRTEGKLSIDRIDSNGPYSFGNIQVLEHHENCRKQ